MKNIEEMKQCSKCGRILPVTSFRAKRGQCRDCEHEYRKEHSAKKRSEPVPINDNLTYRVEREYR